MLLLDKCKFDGAIQLEPSVLTRPLRGLIHSRPTAARAKSGCAGCRRIRTETTGEARRHVEAASRNSRATMPTRRAGSAGRMADRQSSDRLEQLRTSEAKRPEGEARSVGQEGGNPVDWKRTRSTEGE